MTDLLENVLADLRRLRVAYERRGLLAVSDTTRSTGGTAPSPLARDLLLADALLRNVVGAAEEPDPDRPVQVTVFGGTQVGKSTVINVLAGRDIARVHHTAGYTRHAQGFASPGISGGDVLAPFPRAFPGFEQVPREVLSLDRPLEYSLETLDQPIALAGAVLWDAPDCDAVDSSMFQQGFVEALTLADSVVYVTSREKYAVNAILAWVVRLRAAGVGVTAVLNMTPQSQQSELLADMRAALVRVAESEPTVADDLPPPEIIAFEYVADGDVTLLYDPQYAPAGQLRENVLATARDGRADATTRKTRALGWIAEAMPGILQPAVRDLDAWKQWNELVSNALVNFVDDYRRFYLDDPQRYDAFNRVGLEILRLLDPPVPGLQKALVTVRTIVSLPARAILAGSKALYRFASSGGKSIHKPTQIPTEVVTYQEAHNRLLNDMARRLEDRRRSAEPTTTTFWQVLDRGWETRVAQIDEEFRTALAEHRARSDQWIRETAESIYKELAREPVKLNLLRTGRIAADAGAIVVSVKTGGAGDIVHDIVVAPALMSVVEAISRQLAGSYVDQRKEDLRRKLVQDTERFAREVYGAKLGELASQSLEQMGLSEDDAEAVQTLRQRVLDLKEQWEGRR